MLVRREINRSWDVLFDRSLSKQYEKKKMIRLGILAWIMGCLITSAMIFCVVFSSYMSPLPLPLLNFEIKSGVHFDLWQIMGVSCRDCKTADSLSMNLNETVNDYSTIDHLSMNHNDQIISDYSTSERILMNHNSQTLIRGKFSPSVKARVWFMTSNQNVYRLLIASSMVESISKTTHINSALMVMSVVDEEPSPPIVVSCNFTDPKTDVCEINGAVRVHGSSSTIFIDPSLRRNFNRTRWTLKPYPRKTDNCAMKKVTEFTLDSSASSSPPECTVNHTVPAVLFSTGGYLGNFYHEISEMLLPLYLTSKHFNGQVRFLATNYKSWLSVKFAAPLKSLTNFPIIDLDRDPEIHCFPSLIAGVNAHKELGVDSSRTPPYTMLTFSDFIRTAFSLPRQVATPLRLHTKKPRLVMISRQRSRVLQNENEVASMAKKLGFEVILGGTGRDLGQYAKCVNSADVYLGVHGAGLTNMIFLPKNGILLQVIPLGLTWSARTYYEKPAKAMGLRYLEYRVIGEETNLEKRYWGDKAELIFQEQGWDVSKRITLDEQNVTLNVRRFRRTLIEALNLVYS